MASRFESLFCKSKSLVLLKMIAERDAISKHKKKTRLKAQKTVRNILIH